MSTLRRALAAGIALAIGLALMIQCRAPGDANASRPKAAELKDADSSWEIVYSVLQHPRCANCHPPGDVPLQGDERLPHAQNVQRGPEGEGLFAMRCSACHQTANAPGAHLPPGAPHWKLPHPDMPLVFVGRTSAELCRQLANRRQNGNKTPEQLFEHMAKDPLVLWGWNPGEGRAPVSIPHAEFVAAVKAWIDGGCACPE